MALTEQNRSDRLILPSPPERYDPQDQREMRRTLEQFLTSIASRANPNRPYLYLSDYGVVGDGVTDDTAAFQAALTDGATQYKVVYGGALSPLISSGLTMAGPGLLFESAPHGSAGGPGIVVSGSGYTALTVTTGTIISDWNVTIRGTGNTANGVLFQNMILSFLAHTRVYNLDGFGVKLNRCWDNTFGTISVEVCGNASEYAFSMNDDGDTTNETHVMRLQVERAKFKAIFVSANTLDCVIDCIHSEQATPNASYTTWYLGGNRGLYNSVRVASLAPAANASVWFTGGQTQYNAVLTEGAIDVTLEGGGGNAITIVSPEIQGVAHVRTGNTGRIDVYGGTIATYSGDATLLRMYGTYIATLTMGFANSEEWRAQFFGCDIGTLGSSSTVSAATFIGCRILEGGNLLRGKTKLVGCTVTCASAIAHSSGTLEASDTTITADLTYTNNAPIRLVGTKITGTVSCGDAGNVDFLCDDRSTVGGGSSGVGVPTGGAHVVGDRHKNPLPSVGNPKAWVCTVAGTPGTFVSEGNL